MEVSLVSRHIKRTCIQYNNKLRAQLLWPLLDADCRIKTNAIKQIGPPPLTQRMRAGGGAAWPAGGASLMCRGGDTLECSPQTSLSSHVSTTTVCVCMCVCAISAKGTPGFILVWTTKPYCGCQVKTSLQQLQTVRMVFGWTSPDSSHRLSEVSVWRSAEHQ